jgi:hypothetical protein
MKITVFILKISTVNPFYKLVLEEKPATVYADKHVMMGKLVSNWFAS